MGQPRGDWVFLRSSLHDDWLMIFNKKGSVLLVEDETLKDELCKRRRDPHRSSGGDWNPVCILNMTPFLDRAAAEISQSVGSARASCR
jgi:hypothetical protein